MSVSTPLLFKRKHHITCPISSEGDPAGPAGPAPVRAERYRGPGATAAQAAEQRHNGAVQLAGGRFEFRGYETGDKLGRPTPRGIRKPPGRRRERHSAQGLLPAGQGPLPAGPAATSHPSPGRGGGRPPSGAAKQPGRLLPLGENDKPWQRPGRPLPSTCVETGDTKEERPPEPGVWGGRRSRVLPAAPPAPPPTRRAPPRSGPTRAAGNAGCPARCIEPGTPRAARRLRRLRLPLLRCLLLLPPPRPPPLPPPRPAPAPARPPAAAAGGRYCYCCC